MVTRAELRAELRQTLSDHVQWPDTALNFWIDAAIRDYSQHFKRTDNGSIDCSAGVRIYSLAQFTGLEGVLEVEYPQGEDPPRYLSRKSHQQNFIHQPFYDLIGNPPDELILGESPQSGEQIGLVYTTDHTLPASDSSDLSVPEKHMEALKLYVTWQAVCQLEMEEVKDPDTASQHLSMLGQNVTRAEDLYSLKIEQYRKNTTRGQQTGPWHIDRYDRIY